MVSDLKTWAYHGPFPYDSTPSLVTVDFRELRSGVTEVTVTHSQLHDYDARDGAGWAPCLEQLQKLMNLTNLKNLKRREQ